MKKLIFFLIIFFQANLVFSQTATDTLVVAPGANGLYFYHVVEKGETIYSLSRTFSLDPHQLAAANGLTLKTPLKLYQLVKIPLNKQNMTQSAQPSSTSALTPLFHKVIKGETLYRVGKVYDNVPVELLKKWNHLQNNEIATGQYLVIGWLQNNDEKELVNNRKEPAKASTAKEIPEEQPKEDSQTHVGTSVTKTTHGGAFLREVIAAEQSRKAKASVKPAVKVSTPPHAVPPMRGGKTGEVVHSTATTKTSQKDNLFSKMLDKVTKKPEKKNKKPEQDKNVVSEQKDTSKKVKVITANPSPRINNPTRVNNIKTETIDSTSLKLAATSLFEQQYLSQTKNETAVNSKKGAAGWFKSNVKPGSERYYALCDDLPRGTIVKVINPINHKYVFVKVLADIPKQKENYNLIIKLSDAAMQGLGTSQPRFWCKIVYPK